MEIFDWLKKFLGGETTEPPPPPPGAVAPKPPAKPAKTKRAKKAPPATVPPPAEALDTSPFLPIARNDLLGQARNLSGWGVWIGRRDTIPPANDPRTQLIDRGMVTQGLLTPEQLAEMHHVTDLLEKKRGEIAKKAVAAAKAGDAAVEEYRREKVRLKKEKKDAAAKRERERRKAVEHRRATDVIFLGRGVSARLADRASDAAKLKAAGLPVLATPSDVAKALKLSIPKLRWLAFHTEVALRTHYVQFTVPKKSGGTRTLSAPHKTLRAAQEWILSRIVAQLPAEPAAHGFVTGRSTLTNALPHVHRQTVVNMDLEGFFPNVTFRRVRSVFQRAGYSGAVATILALLCTECPRREVTYAGENYFVATGPRGLPQGACTSPGLSNQVARRLDKRLAGLAAKLDLSYTRYADDLTFSGDDGLATRVGYLMARVRNVARDEGFRVNEAKSRVLRRNTAQVVTGLVVNERPGVPRETVRRLRAILHRARTEGLEKQNREGRPDFRAWLRGMIAYVRMARPETGDKLLAELDALEQAAPKKRRGKGA